MPGINKNRNLEYKLHEGDTIYHDSGNSIWEGSIRECTYSGHKNYVYYEEEKLSINKFCKQHMMETRTDLKNYNVNAWKHMYILDNRERKIFIKDIEIFENNENSLKKNECNSINYIMRSNTETKKTKAKKNPRASKRKSTTKRQTKAKTEAKSKAKSKSTKQKNMEEKVMSKFETEMKRFWRKAKKQKIIDYDYQEILSFAIDKIENSNEYVLLNQNKQPLGIARFWVDTNNEIPKKYKNKDNIVSPFGTQLYEYIMDLDSPFHELPRRIYRQFYYDKENDEFKDTNEIFV